MAVQHPDGFVKDVAALVRSRGRIVSDEAIRAWLGGQRRDNRSASEMAEFYISRHKAGLGPGEDRGKRKKHCGVKRGKRAAKKGGAKKASAKKKPAAKKAKTARANPTKRRKSGSRKTRRGPGKRKHAAKRPRHNPTPRKHKMSAAARAAAKRRIAKMPRDSKGRLKPKGARSNPRRKHKTSRRRSRR